MNTLEQLKTAIGEPLKRKLGDVEFEFYPLSVVDLPDLFELAGKIQNKEEEILKKENAKILFELILKMCKGSFNKDIQEDMLDKFVTKNFMELAEILIELHTPDVDKLSPQQKNKIEQLKILRAKNLQDANLGTNQSTN